MKTATPVEVRQREDGVAVLRLTNGERRNVLDLATASALQEAVERLGRDPRARRLVIAGSGGVFAAGADIRELEDARELGLVTAAVAPAEVMDRALELAGKIAGVAPLAAQAIVESLCRDRNLPLADANLRVEGRLAALLASRERREGARQRRERRLEGI